MKVLITGARGQLGSELLATAPAGVEVIATDLGVLDITDAAQVQALVAQTQPALIINAAAYTAVDKAETESALAFRINRDGAGHLAEAAHGRGTRLIHVSTDYVFDGAKSLPYAPHDSPNPINVYGASKLAGEQAMTQRSEGRALIVRTAWVYSATGSNFVKTMLRLLQERKELRVVCDQLGSPTHAAGLARALWGFAALPELRGIYHWTDTGVASWYDFACAIRATLLEMQPKLTLASVIPIATSDYPTAARRPVCSVLDKSSSWAVLGYGPCWPEPLPAIMKCLLQNPA